MINIKKNNPPESLSQYKREMIRLYGKELKGKYIFDNYQEKEKLRKLLAEEQGYICSYCMCRIKLEPLKTKIEHVQSRSEFPERQLDYSNLVICCKGNEGQLPANQHCDTKKGSLSLSFNPSNPDKSIQELISYKHDGVISSVNSVIDLEIHETLNLNLYRLKKNRESIHKTINSLLNRKPRTRTPGEIKSIIDYYQQKDENGEFRPYCGAALFWLKKHQSMTGR